MRYTQVAQALQETKGLLTTLFDVRTFIKVACSISRHHEAIAALTEPWLLDPLPRLHTTQLTGQILRFLLTTGPEVPAAVRAIGTAPPLERVPASVCPDPEALYQDLQHRHGWPAHVVDGFVRNLFSARGAHKAMALRRFLWRFTNAACTAEAQLAELLAYVDSVSYEALAAAGTPLNCSLVAACKLRHKHHSMGTACLLSMRDVTRALCAMCPGPAEPVFLAGDTVAACTSTSSFFKNNKKYLKKKEKG